MSHSFLRAVPLDYPTQHGADRKSGNQRHGAGPRERVLRQHGYDDQKTYQRAHRSQHQGQDGVGVQLPNMLRQSFESVEKIAYDAAPPA
jgi:hypothetical protein